MIFLHGIYAATLKSNITNKISLLLLRQQRHADDSDKDFVL